MLALRPEHADAGRPENLVAGEAVEVAAERGDVDGDVRRGLRAVDQHRNAGGLRHAAKLCHRVDGAQRVGDVGDGQQARTLAQHPLGGGQVEFAGIRNRNRHVVAPTSCHGTMLAWCSISVTSTVG